MEKPKPTHLQIGEFHIPALESGDYHIEVQQTLEKKGIIPEDYPAFESKISFSIQGERFHLLPNQVHSVFPPAGNLGEYSTVLPHIVINRTTLPWERHAIDGKKETPWLALLLFSEDELEMIPGSDEKIPLDKRKLEAQQGYIMQLKELKKPNTSKAWPGIDLERGQDGDDRASVIFVKKSTLEKIVPSALGLRYLAHTRQGTDEKGTAVGEEMAVIIGNRIPKAGATSIVHLVSMEHRYDENGFNFHGAKEDELIPLFSLKSWRFSSLSHRHTFRGLLLHLNQTQLFHTPAPAEVKLDGRYNQLPPNLRELFGKMGFPLKEEIHFIDRAEKEIILKDYHFLIGVSGNVYNQAGIQLFKITLDEDNKKTVAAINEKLNGKIPTDTVIKKVSPFYWWIGEKETGFTIFIKVEGEFISAYKILSDHSPTLRLPETGNNTADKYLKQGFVPLPHFMRQGSKGISWYRGPLSTADRSAMVVDIDLQSVEAADELVMYLTDTGMFDVSYAAAWELGRLLALRSKQFSIDLHRWKRKHARYVAQEEHTAMHPHLPFSTTASKGKNELPDALKKWFDQLWSLEGIPYNYLIPDERMLPPESIRFFYIDQYWMDCLIHGAFSIGAGAGKNHHVPKNGQDGENGTKKSKHPISEYSDTSQKITGFLLKSEVVAGWPGLEIEAIDESEQKLGMLRRQLSPNVLLCLFEGDITQIDFHLKPESFHFGFHQEEENGAIKLFKNPRNAKGEEAEAQINLDEEGIIKNNRTVDIDKMIEKLKKIDLGFKGGFGPAPFALSMVEGVDRVRFKRK